MDFEAVTLFFQQRSSSAPDDERYTLSEALVSVVKRLPPEVRRNIQAWDVAEKKPPTHITRIPTVQYGDRLYVGEMARAFLAGCAFGHLVALRVPDVDPT